MSANAVAGTESPIVRVAGILLLGTVMASVAFSWRWPLIGDATLMHYVVFLLGKGLVPYRQIVDINLPGTYLFEYLVMRVLGWGALAWRMYDLLLVACVAAGTMVVVGRRRIIAGVVSAAMFFLIHVQDGLVQTGERDILIAALVIWAYALRFTAQRRGGGGYLVFASYLCLGVTATIKPLFLPLGVLFILLTVRRMRKAGLSYTREILAGLSGLLVPTVLMVAWLVTYGALPQFAAMISSLLPLHASMGRRPLSYLAAHSVAPLGLLVGLAVGSASGLRTKMSLEGLELLMGVAVAFFAYVEQGKGFPYHRYPMLLLLLIVINCHFVDALQAPNWRRVVAGAALLLQCCFYAPRAAWLVHTFRRDTPFEDALGEQLGQYGPELSSNVQCLDTFGGCINTLYNLRLVQSTGYLYDCYLFGDAGNAKVSSYRDGFLEAFQRARPKIVVMTDQFCFGDPGGFAKLDRWPVLRAELASHYVLTSEWRSPVMERWWSRSEYPPGFRVYRRMP